ncbi:unnamed protein product, partial [marine sediment metagenome]
EVDSCTEGTPTAEICDNLDNDCDGSTDEDYVPTSTSCGVGECAATGTLDCVGGVEVDSCTEGTPTAEICDNLDNDCDGSTDEDYVPTSTSCGVGECAATGTLDCVGGVEVDSCTEGTPTAEICDSLDNDCDGSTADDGEDEAWYNQPTSCGVGECADTGVLICVAGAQSDTCTPGTPGTEVCDDLDNDCDGLVDEDGVCAEPEADARITAQSFVDPLTEIAVSENVDYTLRATLHNNGSYGPVDVSISTIATPPPNCTATPDPANPTSA